MRTAIIDNGIVVNIAEATQEFATDQGWIPTEVAQIGWTYSGGNFTAPAPKVPTATEVRSKRDKLLSASDWTQVADAPVDQTAWATYRQALRDIPEQVGFPADVTWPTEPA